MNGKVKAFCAVIEKNDLKILILHHQFCKNNSRKGENAPIDLLN
jgi:hypothetical protein